MSELNEREMRVVARYVDGELAGEESAAIERRLVQDPDLRAAVDELREFRGLFAAERDVAPPRPTAGFRDRVLGEVQRLPTADELRATETSRVVEFEAFCRRLMVAAALLIAVGVLAFAGFVHSGDTGELEASETEVRQEMERLDALIRAESPDRR